MTQNKTKRCLICIGNQNRGDDGIALLVARNLEVLTDDGITVFTQNGEMGHLMDTWQGFDEVTIVDAMSSGAPLGSIKVFDVSQNAMPCRSRNSSTHDFGLYEAIELGRILGRIPKKIFVYGIEGENFSLGENVSPALKERIDDLSRAITQQMMRKESQAS